jgi:hypothetical protein
VIIVHSYRSKNDLDGNINLIGLHRLSLILMGFKRDRMIEDGNLIF